MKVFGGVAIQLHTFLCSTLDAGGQLHVPGCFIQLEIAPCNLGQRSQLLCWTHSSFIAEVKTMCLYFRSPINFYGVVL
jgi:hypothetical protein